MFPGTWKLPLKFGKDWVSTAEIFLIWTSVARANVAWTNVTMTIGSVLLTRLSVTAEILLTLSFSGWVVVQSHFIVKPNLVLRLGWGFDKIYIC